MRKGSRKTVAAIIAAAAFLAAASAAFAVGVSFARARSVRNQQISLSYYDTGDGVVLLAAGYNGAGELTGRPETAAGGEFALLSGWHGESVDGAAGTAVFESTFFIANGKRADAPAPFDQNASLELFLTLGAVDPAKTEVTLECGGVRYSGVPTVPDEKSDIFRAYGEGAVYKFVTPGGEPPVLKLKGGVLDSVPVTLTVRCPAEYPSAAVITVCGTPADN